jgi:SAM-dependent methyltransferase
MRLRESGMLEESYWETLFDVEHVLDRLGIDDRLRDVVELGCGYGTFTLPVARRISGTMRTFDIDADMVERTVRRAAFERVDNILCERRDVFSYGFGIEPQSQDACLLFNILHGEEPMRLLIDAARVIRTAGLVHVIHWHFDSATPRGPSMDIRPRPGRIVEWADRAGLAAGPHPVLELPPWHYGIRFHRRSLKTG